MRKYIPQSSYCREVVVILLLIFFVLFIYTSYLCDSDISLSLSQPNLSLLGTVSRNFKLCLLLWMILFPSTIWLRIILLLSPSTSMSRVVTLWPSIKSVSNFQILFVCWFYNCFSHKLHILMPYHILWCRICNSYNMEIMVGGRNCNYQ